MGKRSDRRKFRRRRRWAGFILLVSLALMVFGLFTLTGEESTNAQPSASLDGDLVARVTSPEVAGAPKAVAEQKQDEAAVPASEEEDKKTTGEKQQVDQEAATQPDKKEAAKKPASHKPAIPTPPTNDLWISIPALGLYDLYVTNTSNTGEGSAGPETPLDYGLIKTSQSGFPWQPNANTYIQGHRLGWPGTGSYHVFYNLPLLALGDKIYLGDDNGTTYTYEVTEFHEVTPDQTWISGPQAGRNMVSLQTCIENYGDYWTMGPNWYVRYIVQADRVSVDVAN